MNKLIAVVGPSGVGKTSLVRALSKAGDFSVAYEQHAERPFQSLFAESTSGTGKQYKRYALANQLDYLLFRAEQEKALRASPHIALTDGGLDLDFHGFTRLFHARGWLDDAEFDLCRRFYIWNREFLPPPGLVIALNAPEETIRQRLAARNRINIASEDDTLLFNKFLEEWLDTIPPRQKMQMDVSSEGLDFSRSTQLILGRLQSLPNGF
ncbi:MAG: deoxynucleoside kinase [Chloroflexi bacterium]|nr:deoxynucleoside kinase [Chloroflexota bacterium]